MNDYTAAEARAQVYADTIGVEPPARLVDQDGAPALDLMNFCRRYGASLDWIFCGDQRPMIRASHALAKAGLRP